MISLSNYKALIFDMDGTLTDNMHYHHLAWMKFIEEKGLGIDAETFERDYHKGTLIEVMARFFPHLTTEEQLFILMFPPIKISFPIIHKGF